MGQSFSHPDGEFARKDEATGLAGSRAEFATSLPRRIESVLGAIGDLANQLESPGLRDNLLRRLHALAASAKVLGFAAAADLLTRSEHRLRTAQADSLAADLKKTRKLLLDLPALVQPGSPSIAPPHASLAPSGHVTKVTTLAEPLVALLFGKDELRQALLKTVTSSSGLEIECCTQPETLRHLAAALGPDVLLLDAAEGSITLIVDELTQAPETAAIPIVALNVPDEAAPGLVELGVRSTLSPRATDQQILRTLRQVGHSKGEPSPSPQPLGTMSLRELAEHLAHETFQGLVESANPSAQNERITLGDGTVVRAALWSALAQIREHVVERTDGKIRFERGPDGSHPMAPGRATLGRGSAQPVASVELTSRRILVVDDDPAIAWLVAGTLTAAGASVTVAHDGERALELAYDLWPELVVSDILMPGLDGFALCHALKRDVLLRDVPVVLLSWKEDLLFRLRELGADADGYLRKEATASTIVGRVRELLLPRQSLERRITQGLSASCRPPAEVRGRLDETTVRQLLEIVAALPDPVRIALRNSSTVYDLRVRDGSLRSARSTHHDGRIEQGRALLESLIGVTAGRFSLSIDREPYEPEFEQSLAELLRPVALRTRAAQRALSAASLASVEELVLDHDTFSDEHALLPLSLRPIADELGRGIPPRQLLASASASAHLLETVLADAARRGKVRAVKDVNGADLLGRELAVLRTPRAASPVKVATPPTPAPLFSFQLTPQPPEGREPSATPLAAVKWQDSLGRAGAWKEPGQASAAALATPALADGETPKADVPKSLAHSVSEDLDWAEELSWDTPAPSPSAPPPSKPPSKHPSSKPAPSTGFMRPTLATLEPHRDDETPDLANAVARAVSEVTPQPIPVAVVAQVPEPAVARAVSEVTPQPIPEPVVAQVPEPVVARAVSEVTPQPIPEPVVTQVPEPVVAQVPEPVVAQVPEPVVVATIAEVAGDQPSAQLAQTESVLTESRLANLDGSLPSPPTDTAYATALAPAPQAPAGTAESTAEQPAIVAASTRPEPLEIPRELDSEPVFPLISANPPPCDVQPAIEVGEPEEPIVETRVESSEDEIPEPRNTLRSPPQRNDNAVAETESAPSELDASSAPGTTSPSEPEPPLEALSPPKEPQTPSQSEAPARVPSQAPSSEPRSYTWTQAMGLAFLAFAVTFAAFATMARSCQRDRVPATAREEALAAPTALAVDAGEPAEVPSDQAPPSKLEETPLPKEVTLAPNQALLEVMTGGGHAIFVDDTFVGRGPSRVVTVTAGPHVVRTRLNGLERSSNVEVGAGRSMRLSLE